LEESYYKNSLEHLLHELKLLDLYLVMSVLKLRAREGELPNWNDYSGLIISDKEIDDLLAHDITDSTFFKCPEYL
jgi:hypothetical protein